MAETFTTKRNDTAPIEVFLKDRDGRVDLTGASVKFLMQDLDGTQIISNSATVVNASEGEVKYVFNEGDVDESGEYEAEFEVTTAAGEVHTFPNDDYIVVVIIDDVG